MSSDQEAAMREAAAKVAETLRPAMDDSDYAMNHAGRHGDRIAAAIRALPLPAAPSEPTGEHKRLVGEWMRSSLEWYAEQAASCRKITSEGEDARRALDRDGGERARAALSAPSEPTGEGRDDMLVRAQDVIRYLTRDRDQLRADLARMKAALEWIVKPDIGMAHFIFRQEAKLRAEEALKGPTP